MVTPPRRLPQLLGRFDPGNQHAVGSDVERPFNRAGVQFHQANQQNGVAAHRGPQMADEIAPIKMPMLGIEHDPIEAQEHRHFRDAGGFERYP